MQLPSAVAAPRHPRAVAVAGRIWQQLVAALTPTAPRRAHRPAPHPYTCPTTGREFVPALPPIHHASVTWVACRCCDSYLRLVDDLWFSPDTEPQWHGVPAAEVRHAR